VVVDDDGERCILHLHRRSAPVRSDRQIYISSEVFIHFLLVGGLSVYSFRVGARASLLVHIYGNCLSYWLAPVHRLCNSSYSRACMYLLWTTYISCKLWAEYLFWVKQWLDLL